MASSSKHSWQNRWWCVWTEVAAPPRRDDAASAVRLQPIGSRDSITASGLAASAPVSWCGPTSSFSVATTHAALRAAKARDNPHDNLPPGQVVIAHTTPPPPVTHPLVPLEFPLSSPQTVYSISIQHRAWLAPYFTTYLPSRGLACHPDVPRFHAPRNSRRSLIHTPVSLERAPSVFHHGPVAGRRSTTRHLALRIIPGRISHHVCRRHRWRLSQSHSEM